MNFGPSEVRAYYADRVRALRITNQREWRGPCPVHSGKDLNFAVNAETGLAQCHSQCGRGWDILSLEMELCSVDFARAKERVFSLIGRPNVPWEERNVEAIYDYTDETGKLLYQVLRYHGKTFRQRRLAGGLGTWGTCGGCHSVCPELLNRPSWQSPKARRTRSRLNGSA